MAVTKTRKAVAAPNGDEAFGSAALDAEVQGALKIFLRPIRKEFLLVTISGDTPLFTNQIPERTKRELLDKYHSVKRSKEEKEKLFPPLTEAEAFEQAIYRNDLGEPCFPARGVHKAMLTALPAEEESDQKIRLLRQSFAVFGELLPIQESEPVMRQDPVKNWNARGVLAIATRAYFRRPWSLVVPLCHDAEHLSQKTLLTIINRAGFFPGIGAWRGDCRGGLFGRFHVDGAQQVSAAEFEAQL
jgi:hypothetical protein